jgi:exodeoxyribonuclease-3
VEPQARYIEAKIADYHICNLYLPNGNPVNSMKFEYKLRCAPQFT